MSELALSEEKQKYYMTTYDYILPCHAD